MGIVEAGILRALGIAFVKTPVTVEVDAPLARDLNRGDLLGVSSYAG
jgi:hypothetical protein